MKIPATRALSGGGDFRYVFIVLLYMLSVGDY